MAEARTTRSENTTGREQAVARRDQDRGSLQHRQPAGGWLSDPFDMMDRMTEEMDRMFERVFGDIGMPRRSWMARSPLRSLQRENMWAPRLEAFQKADRFIVRAELPGLKKDDVQVDVTDNALTIHGERHEEHEEDREGYYHSERQYGQFYRTIPLPEGVIADSARASFKNGVLEVSMQAPPAEATRGRRLEIKEGSESGERK